MASRGDLLLHPQDYDRDGCIDCIDVLFQDTDFLFLNDHKQERTEDNSQ